MYTCAVEIRFLELRFLEHLDNFTFPSFNTENWAQIFSNFDAMPSSLRGLG